MEIFVNGNIEVYRIVFNAIAEFFSGLMSNGVNSVLYLFTLIAFFIDFIMNNADFKRIKVAPYIVTLLAVTFFMSSTVDVKLIKYPLNPENQTPTEIEPYSATVYNMPYPPAMLLSLTSQVERWIIDLIDLSFFSVVNRTPNGASGKLMDKLDAYMKVLEAQIDDPIVRELVMDFSKGVFLKDVANDLRTSQYDPSFVLNSLDLKKAMDYMYLGMPYNDAAKYGLKTHDTNMLILSKHMTAGTIFKVLNNVNDNNKGQFITTNMKAGLYYIEVRGSVDNYVKMKAAQMAKENPDFYLVSDYVNNLLPAVEVARKNSDNKNVEVPATLDDMIKLTILNKSIANSPQDSYALSQNMAQEVKSADIKFQIGKIMFVQLKMMLTIALVFLFPFMFILIFFPSTHKTVEAYYFTFIYLALWAPALRLVENVVDLIAQNQIAGSIVNSVAGLSARVQDGLITTINVDFYLAMIMYAVVLIFIGQLAGFGVGQVVQSMVGGVTGGAGAAAASITMDNYGMAGRSYGNLNAGNESLMNFSRGGNSMNGVEMNAASKMMDYANTHEGFKNKLLNDPDFKNSVGLNAATGKLQITDQNAFANTYMSKVQTDPQFARLDGMMGSGGFENIAQLAFKGGSTEAFNTRKGFANMNVQNELGTAPYDMFQSVMKDTFHVDLSKGGSYARYMSDQTGINLGAGGGANIEGQYQGGGAGGGSGKIAGQIHGNGGIGTSWSDGKNVQNTYNENMGMNAVNKAMYNGIMSLADKYDGDLTKLDNAFKNYDTFKSEIKNTDAYINDSTVKEILDMAMQERFIGNEFLTGMKSYSHQVIENGLYKNGQYTTDYQKIDMAANKVGFKIQDAGGQAVDAGKKVVDNVLGSVASFLGFGPSK
ncbi:MAG: hypothetical protein HPY53_11095 [Brevinematales bacterium]|nr:hypothetical protein [Brevinematales bacterium]